MRDLFIVVLVSTDTDPASLLRSSSRGRALDEMLGAPDRRTVVSVIAARSPHEVIPGVTSTVSLEFETTTRSERALTAAGVYALARILDSHRLGRALASIFPTDPSRAFRRALRASSAATELIVASDILIAADAPAVLAAWSELRSGRATRAFHTISAAAREMAAS